MPKIESIFEKMLAEGMVARARTSAVKRLNKQVYNIEKMFRSKGLDVEVDEADVSDFSSRIEVQFGLNKKFKKSQIVSITIYDVDDYLVELPAAVAISIGSENYSKFSDLRKTKRYLIALYQKVFGAQN